ncbi:Centriolar coiled-coil protein of 110 kDa [Pseudolycoriella hygida]|uniref:Centriolar coiled-coil protein of 110 kDa n=1 Tax=Pseudolycoriella hygida TaxID=35572 RepID=A0A9Q0RZZ0_9DIPT|nr:Centriolar coiled-coil protein of 110 kDa [Pseudolycoriella hygida]
MYNGIDFLSVFKIEDKPILRPCLSESKREEIQRFKAKALEVERRLAQRKGNSMNKNGIVQADQIDFHSNTENTQTDPENASVHSEMHTDNENFVTSISEWDISSIPGTDTETVAVSLYSPAYQENCHTAGQSMDTFVPSTIIRSDSFIVDEPSECFLKQLEDTGVIPSSSTSLTDVSNKTELNQTKIFIDAQEKRKPEVKKTTNPKLKKAPTKSFSFKKGRIPSENISNLPDKLIRKCQNSNVSRERLEKVVSKQSSAANQIRKPTTPVESTFTQTDSSPESDTVTFHERIAEMMASVEEKFHKEIISFLDKQKREQEAFLQNLLSQVKVKQDAFHNSLIMQIKTFLGDGTSNSTKNPLQQIDSSGLSNDVNGNWSSSKDRGNHCNQTEKDKAATKINAFVRGYLTRRLFKTEHVQEIVKTVRDTLYFVIDLHFESSEVESVADIQMKHNLLQQLEACRYNLSHIFLSKTRAEQMDMIAIDRDMKTHRLLASSQKDKEPSNTNRSMSFSLENKLKKLKIIEL